MWISSFLETLVQDTRYGLRMIGRAPGFTAIAVLSLAIGIGANTTIFTIANEILFRTPTGVANPRRLVDIGRTENGRGFSQSSYQNYLDVRQRTTTFEELYAYQPVAEPMSLGAISGAERIYGSIITANYFDALGARPVLGRLFVSADGEESTASPIVVLSYGLWTRRFNQDPTIVGQTLTLNGHIFSIVGVAPEGFRGTSLLVTDAWIPASSVTAVILERTRFLTSRDLPWLMMGGRLKGGVSISQANAELNTIIHALAQEYPDQNRDIGLRLAAIATIPGGILPVAGFLGLLMGIVSLVLIIACINIASVLLARAFVRRREIAIRLAMGAGRGRLMRQLLTETILLFILGGAVGLVTARIMTILLIRLLPMLPIPVDASLPLDNRVIAFTAGLSLIAAILSGLAPALQATCTDVVAALKDGAQGHNDRLRLRNVFVIGQVAISLVLVIVGGLFIRALQKGVSINPGFNSSNVEIVSLDLSLAGYTSTTGRVFVSELLDRLRKLPAVQSATIAQTLPMGWLVTRLMGLTVPGVQPPNGQRFFEADSNAVEPGYFATLRIPILAGRDFSSDDRGGMPSVAIVSESAARRFWPGQDPVGKVLALEAGPWRKREDARTLLVVGVAGDVKSRSLSDDFSRPYIYMPLQQQYGGRLVIIARTTQGQRIAGEIRTLLASTNPNLPIVEARTLEELMAVSLLPQRIAGLISGSLGIVGLILAAMGIYGVTAYMVTQRTREIGVRIALGAQYTDILGMVLKQGMSLVAIGSIIGFCLSAILSRLLSKFLLGVPPIDPVTFIASAALFTGIGLAACYLPARRAAEIEPMEAIRIE